MLCFALRTPTRDYITARLRHRADYNGPLFFGYTKRQAECLSHLSKIRRFECRCGTGIQPVGAVPRTYLTIRNASSSLPVSEICLKRRVLPSISTTLKEFCWDKNLLVKGCQLDGSVC